MHTTPTSLRSKPAPLLATSGGADSPRSNGGAIAPNSSNLFAPDAWLTDEARDLLAAIVKASPERSEAIAVTGGGQVAALGYRGRDAAKLRALFDKHLARLFDWMNETRFGTPEQQDRRNRIIAYASAHDADATIERALDAADELLGLTVEMLAGGYARVAA